MTTTDQNTTSPRATYIKNLRSDGLHEITFDELLAKPARHAEFPTKGEFSKWSEDQSTDHVFFSLAMPKNPKIRASKDNEVRQLRGLVADYDAPQTRDSIIAAAKRSKVDFPVAYASSTYSGNARMAWIFERPLNVLSNEHAQRVLAHLAKQMKLGALLAGFDPVFSNPGQYYELGRDWLTLNASARIPQAETEAASMAAAQRLDFRDAGPAIPMHEIEAEVHRQFPGRWTGTFAAGARGVRFWDPTATNPNGAWLRENGVASFTGDSGFLSWGAILGHDFVHRYEANRVGSAIADIHFNAPNKSYWRRINNSWSPEGADTLKRHLVASGLRAEKRRGENQSEVDRALHTIESTRRVDGAAPFIFDGRELVYSDNKTYLNISRVEVKEPAPGHYVWGDRFPWTANYIDRLLGEEQRRVFLSWLARFYQGGLRHEPKLGQVLVLAGTHGAGKSLLSNFLVKNLMGGAQKAAAFLTGQTEFNSSLFESAVWTVDDVAWSSAPGAHRRWTELLKRQAADPDHVYHPKYQNPVSVRHQGRVIVSLNTDPDSIRMLPGVDSSAEDKFVYLLTNDTEGVDFTNPEQKILEELPFLAAFLRNFTTPPDLVGTPRFGLIAYKHPWLVQKAREGSDAGEFIDILERWRTSYFLAEDVSNTGNWVGRATDLVEQLAACPSLEVFKRTFSSAPQVGRYLAKAVKFENVPWLKLGDCPRGGSQRYVILNPKLEPKFDDGVEPPNRRTVRFTPCRADAAQVPTST